MRTIVPTRTGNQMHTAVEAVGACSETAPAEKNTSEKDRQEDFRCTSSQKKHKKHKKHKSKKKKRNREKESSSESGAELDAGTKHQPRRGTPAAVNKEQSQDNNCKSRCHKRTTGKRKKKKKRRKSEERGNSSDSDSEFVSKQRDSKCGQRSSPRRREDLPDIIPKQDSSNKERRDEESYDGRSYCSRSQSHSYCHSHSCSVRRNSHSQSGHHHRRSRSRSLSSSHLHRTWSSSSEKKRVLDQSVQSTQAPSKGLQLLQLVSSTTEINIKAEEQTESNTELQSPDGVKPAATKQEQAEDTAGQDKDQLLEIAKANAAAMCAKAGMPIPASLRSTVLPLALPSMAMNAAMASMTAATMTAALSNIGTLSSLLPLPSITNKPPPVPAQSNIAALEEVKRKVAKQANSISIKEFTDKCKMIVDSKGELPVAMPHVSDEEDDGKPFGGSALREQKAISFSINNTTVRPAVRSDAGMAKEFPVSSGCQHRKKEGEALGAYGEWVPVDKAADEAAAASRKALTSVPIVTSSVSSGETATAAGLPAVVEQPVFVAESDSVFPNPPMQPVDISQAVTERIKAQRRLAENPYDVNAICMLSRAQEQVDAWAQSNTVPGLFTGSTGAQVLTSEELSTSGPQAWLKKDQFLRAAPVSGGVGEFLMRKMGWKTGEGLGRNREGTVEPIIIDFKVDRKGLVAEGEKPQKQTGGLVVTKDLMGKHPVSALIELCNKRRIMQPDFVMVHHSGPDHRKNFLFKVGHIDSVRQSCSSFALYHPESSHLTEYNWKLNTVTVNGVDYQPQTASPNKKHAKAMAATVALQALGEVPVDGPGLYTGPVFTAASTGPLFST
ncbi:hypothetical protein PAMP_016418 [Pampus punctatissimus]